MCTDRCLNISIVTYRTDPAELQACLDCLGSPVVSRVYVVDNCGRESDDPSPIAELCRSRGVGYIANSNTGFGPAHNLAMRRSLADPQVRYHLVLNSDVTFEAGTLERILEFMDANPEVGQLQPAIVYPDGSPQYTCRLLPTPWDVFGRRFMPSFLFKGRNRRYTLQRADRAAIHNIPYHQGSFMMLRTEALRHEGLFDERFFMYPEDIDLTRRIHRHWLTLYWPGATVVHAHRAESYHSLRLLRIHIANMARYFNKYGWFCDPERRRINRQTLRRELPPR